jgi:hypothetical protein
VTGNFESGAVGSTGAGSIVNGNFVSVLAGNDGAGSRTDGNFNTGTFPTFGAGASVGGTTGTTAAGDTTAMTSAVQNSLATALAATMPTSTTFYAGVYSAASWSTTAGTTLYLDGQNRADQTWVFNIADILSTGANSHIALINAEANAQVFWNTGGYASPVADSSFLGSVLATGSISVGADAELRNLAGFTVGACFPRPRTWLLSRVPRSAPADLPPCPAPLPMPLPLPLPLQCRNRRPTPCCWLAWVWLRRWHAGVCVGRPVRAQPMRLQSTLRRGCPLQDGLRNTP